MFEVVGPNIEYNGINWCPWLTLMLTPVMLNGLVAELNEAMAEAENESYENGRSDGYDEGYNEGEEYANSMKEEAIEGLDDDEEIEGIN